VHIRERLLHAGTFTHNKSDIAYQEKSRWPETYTQKGTPSAAYICSAYTLQRSSFLTAPGSYGGFRAEGEGCLQLAGLHKSTCVEGFRGPVSGCGAGTRCAQKMVFQKQLVSVVFIQTN
jgi:hypothetical protein